MQEYATAKLNYTDEISANKVMQMVQAFLKNYEYEEPEKCSWIDYLNVKILQQRYKLYFIALN